MDIGQVRQHENGILNIFDNRTQVSHNKLPRDTISFEAQDYALIFDHEPSFYEKKAFTQVLRRKWMQDMRLVGQLARRKQLKSSQNRC